MDGLAATRKLRALEAQEAQDSSETTRSIRIPIVGLSADIQQSTKEVRKLFIVASSSFEKLRFCVAHLRFLSFFNFQI